MDYVLRFFIGGLLVSAFAVVGQSVQPKSFAGLFGGAPSIALAGLVLVIWKEGAHVAALEARSMLLGSIALVAYSVACSKAVIKRKIPPWLSSGALWILWLAVAFLLKAVVG